MTEFYQNRIFSVEDNLFYENNLRIGYFEDEEKEEILENNHKAVVDRLTDLRDSNIDLKRSNKKLRRENEKLKLQIGELLYQIGEVGKNNKTCRECECFIPECNICWMWDMKVEADDVVVACDQRKVKKTK